MVTLVGIISAVRRISVVLAVVVILHQPLVTHCRTLFLLQVACVIRGCFHKECQQCGKTIKMKKQKFQPTEGWDDEDPEVAERRAAKQLEREMRRYEARKKERLHSSGGFLCLR